ESMKVSWVVDPNVFERFVVQYKPADSSDKPLEKTLPGKVSTVDLTDLIDDTEYIIKLIGFRRGKPSKPLVGSITSVSGVPTDSANELVISDITSESMKVSWVVDPNVFERFVVQYKPADSSEKPLEKTLPGKVSTVDLTDLIDDTEYIIKLIGFRRGKPSKQLVAQVKTVTSVSGVPTDSANELVISDITSESMKVSWEVDPNVFERFVVQYKPADSSEKPLEKTLPGKVSTVDLTDLIDDTEYIIKLIGFRRGKPSKPLVGSITSVSGVPTDSANELVISDITSESMKVSWVVDPNVFERFVVQFKPADSSDKPLEKTLPGKVSTVDLTDLIDDTEYIIKLIGFRRGKPSKPLVSVTSVSGVPTDSANELVISDITSESMKVSWEVDPNVFERFVVLYKPADSSDKPLEKSLPGKDSTVDLTDLIDDTEYIIKLIGFRRGKPSKPLVAQVKTGVPTDSANELVISDITSESMKVSWVVDPNVFERFVVQYKPADSSEKPLEKTLPGKVSTVDLTDLIDDTEYIIKLIGFRRATTQEPSKEVSVTSVSGVPTDSANELVISDITSESMKVSWVVDPKVFERFIVQCKPIDSQDKPLEKTLPGHISTVDFTALIDDTEYIIKLIGYRRGKPSKPLVAQVKTGVATDSANELVISDITSESMKVSWVVDPNVFERFVVQYKPADSSDKPLEKTLPGKVSTVDLTDLIDDTEYIIKLIGYRRGKPSKPLVAQVKTEPKPKSTPLP
uniref:Fibronectin type-III domain-containing protein n=1 Tax=Petromyzon marinus TaxID=7757 RepID=S4RJW6_PETMA